MNNAILAGGIPSIAIGLGGSKIYHKATGKPAGAPGSIAHVLTNDKLDSKPATLAEMAKESAKDTVTLGRITLGTAAATSLIVGNSNKAATFFNNLINKAGNALSKVTINNNNLKEIIKNLKLYQKINNLPLPAKAAIAAASAVFAIAAPIIALVSSQKQGYIEGKHEVNNNQQSQYEKMHKGTAMGCVA